ncbi:methyltransferase domain protein [Oesophagostomum dentatum]|uniref:Methyltransferase domain protein n=1 Tax=Oesophagostomum dentatum TaxID=61180 RepID=A0A0B1TIE1_OESDE|nr:methyltransferase domain protein [Oesophagostomum dentatum]
MYYNPSKERRVGCKLDPGKILRKTHKCWEQLRRHDPDVEISEEVTEHLFVSNSSVLCGVSLEELEEIFQPFDANASFTVFPNKSSPFRSYSFVSFSTKEQAEAAREALHGTIPAQLRVSHQPFLISYVHQLPSGVIADNAAKPGDLFLTEDYISEEEEKALTDMILGNEDANALKHRAVIHYGYEFDYSQNAAFKPTKPIPPLINKLIDKLVADSHVTVRPDQVTVNVYEPGQGIPSHYDRHSSFEDPIVCLRIVNRKHDINPLTHRVVPRRLRISVTFRKTRHEPCQCPYKEFCDWDREGEMAVPSDDKSALRLENQYVSEVYESIASHFDETRLSGWTGVKKFMNSLPAFSVVYDVGCGNGKYLLPNDNLLKIGCDRSQMLCEIVQKKGCMVVRADALSLPFREGADAVLSIAVLHHIASPQRRRNMIAEILRDSVIEEVAKETSRLKVHDGKEFVQQDLLVPWRIDEKGETFMRYYHVFEEGEMDELLRSVNGCHIESIEKEQGNYIAVIAKQ